MKHPPDQPRPTGRRLFHTGRIVATPGALAVLSSEDVLTSLSRHVRGDWGDVPPEDHRSNNLALERDSRLLSAYATASGTKFWVITEADRSVTTILLPEEY